MLWVGRTGARGGMGEEGGSGPVGRCLFAAVAAAAAVRVFGWLGGWVVGWVGGLGGAAYKDKAGDDGGGATVNVRNC